MNHLKKFIHQWAWILLIIFCIIGIFKPFIGVIALICMLAPVIVAFFKGRLWCGNFCPRGSFNDIILSKLSLKRKMPKWMLNKWFKLFFLVLLLSAFGTQLYFAWGNMYDVGAVFVRMIIVTTLITILLGIGFHHRAWCTICPMGTLAHYVSKLELSKRNAHHIKFKENSCVNCKVCNKNCPMGITVQSHCTEGTVIDGNCIKCSKCVDVCPKNALIYDK